MFAWGKVAAILELRAAPPLFRVYGLGLEAKRQDESLLSRPGSYTLNRLLQRTRIKLPLQEGSA